MINRTMSWRFRKDLDEVKALIMNDLANGGRCDSNSLRAIPMGRTTGFYLANTIEHRTDPRYRNLKLKIYQPNEEVTYVYLDLNGIPDDAKTSYYPDGAILVDMTKPEGERIGEVERSTVLTSYIETELEDLYNQVKDIISDIHYDSMYA